MPPSKTLKKINSQDLCGWFRADKRASWLPASCKRAKASWANSSITPEALDSYYQRHKVSEGLVKNLAPVGSVKNVSLKTRASKRRQAERFLRAMIGWFIPIPPSMPRPVLPPHLPPTSSFLVHTLNHAWQTPSSSRALPLSLSLSRSHSLSTQQLSSGSPPNMSQIKPRCSGCLVLAGRKHGRGRGRGVSH